MLSFIVIGINDSHAPRFSREITREIEKGKVFSGGKRHREIVNALLPQQARWIDIAAPLDETFKQYEEARRNGTETIVVFASGDPLFFGFANTIRRKMPQAEIKVFPAFHSLQMLAHRLVMPYQELRTVSLTGRSWQELDRVLIERTPEIGLLTDGEHSPAAIARRMTEFGYTAYRMHVGEHLGNPERERVTSCSLAEASVMKFDAPNCVIVRAEEPGIKPFGIDDRAFELLDGRERMITKMPIRLLSLQALALNTHQALWDIGSCTGSISIEARLLFPHLSVTAFEIREEGRRLMETNSRKFGAPGIRFVSGDFLTTDISNLPRPDAVFIGGHGGKLKEVMRKAKTVLRPGGCIVMNSVTSTGFDLFERMARELNLALQPALHLVFNDYNPIDILKVINR